MRTSNFNLLSENVLTINEMFNVRGGDGDEGQVDTTTKTTTNAEGVDIIL
jgi:hypothetical protein